MIINIFIIMPRIENDKEDINNSEINNSEEPEFINEITNYVKKIDSSISDDSSSKSTHSSDSSLESDDSSKSSKDDSSKSSKDDSDNSDNSNDSDDSDDEFFNDSDSSKTHVSQTKYARDALFGNQVWKNKLFENKFSHILKFLEFSRENRGVSQKHVDDIYNHYIENPDEFIKPLDIMCYFEDGLESDHFYIADGQHRTLALKKLYEEKLIDKEVLYFIHDVHSQEDIRKTIKYLNSSNPVTSIYSFEKIPDLLKKIGSKYTNIYSDNLNHNNDKMNEIKLRDHIEEIKLFKDTDLGVDEIFNFLLDFNKKVRDDYLNRENKASADKKLFDRIAQTHQFYGLIYRNYTWLNDFYNYAKEMKEKRDVQNMLNMQYQNIQNTNQFENELNELKIIDNSNSVL